ncbi:MAG: putative toxin-antitoxin system toxin component, PIN family [Bacteroidia bacterium]|nr:putative toxin-antitoxin system toxin component, PIN family [Bacteroidia bacterium]
MRRRRPVVIDTNCLVQMLSKHSPYRPIWDSFLHHDFILCISNEILDEYQEIIERLTTPRIAENVTLLLLNSSNVHFVDPHFRLGLITSDPDDNKFVDCAFACGADYIVSEDSHFNILKQIPFPILEVITLDDFLQKL